MTQTQNPTAYSSIADIQNMFDDWRSFGSCTVESGVELIAPFEANGTEQHLHVLYQGLSPEELDELEEAMARPIPKLLRAFYRRVGGASLWNGAFRIYGYNPVHGQRSADRRYPTDVLRFNHELDALDWMHPEAFAFADNSWDMSVHITGIPGEGDVVQRCKRSTGAVLEVHDSIWVCVARRLYHIDDMMM